jgi:hypothetical protein
MNRQQARDGFQRRTKNFGRRNFGGIGLFTNTRRARREVAGESL